MSDVKLYLGDCLEILPTLEAQSVDAIITDIPYGKTACAWDTVIPFEPMWAQVKRLLKPRGVFVTTASQPFTSELVMSNLDWFKYEWIWDKHHAVGFLNAKIRPMLQHESILVFSKASPLYNPQMSPRLKPDKRRCFTQREDSAYQFVNDDEKERVYTEWYPKSILEFVIANDGKEHPTQKPVAMYSYLIRTYTNEGDTVLDFCMGSGTAGVACVNTGRDFIGIELKPEYYAIAERRIAEAQLQIRMPI